MTRFVSIRLFSCSASISVILGILAICSAAIANESPVCARSVKPAKDRHEFFNSVQKACAGNVFSDALSPREKEALHAFVEAKKLPNGKTYGDSVRRFHLKGKSTAQVEKEMKKMGCPMKREAMREGGSGPIRKDKDGKEIPLLMFLCPDGGVVRIKPVGDPGNKYRPQPHGSKALRYPADSDYVTFDDEVLKVDEEGNPVPKAPKGLAKFYSDEKIQSELVDGWADDAHSDLAAPKAP
mgnify:CR=1 FL=1